MRLLPLICVVLLLGCAKSKPPASESAATGGTGAAVATLSLADVAGTWEGPVLAAGTDTVLTNVVLIATTEPTGWTMKVTNAKLPARTALVTDLRVAADGDSVIVDAGPYPSVLREGQQVTTHGVYRLQDGKLRGEIRASYPASGETIMLRSAMMKKAG